MEVTPTEGVGGRLASQAAAPFANATHGVQGDLWCGFHVLKHCLQRHTSEAWTPISCLTERVTSG